jgi:hypothetical protein
MNSVRRAAVGLAVGAVVVLTPLAALADTPAPAGAEFGEHVSTCAREMGFSGTHNPGVHHQGFAGWDGMRCGG